MENPVIGSLDGQVQENKKYEKAVLNQMSSVPSTNDVYITERLTKLKVSHYDEDNFPLLLPPPPPSKPCGFFSSRGRAKSDDDDNDDDGRYLNPNSSESTKTRKNFNCSW